MPFEPMGTDGQLADHWTDNIVARGAALSDERKLALRRTLSDPEQGRNAMASTRKQEISEETQRRLVAAATELAAERGASAMSIQAVADLSGISRGSVAWHFGSKDGLIRAVVEASFQWALAELRDNLAAAPEQGVAALIEANLAIMSRPEARIFATILLEATSKDSPVRDTYAEQYRALRRYYADYLRSVSAPVADPDAMAVALLGGTLGINIQHRLDPQHVDRRSAVTVLEAVYTRALTKTDNDAEVPD
ncbi:TetR/AcrR family transcriptional regulator [Prescottella equi]|uniref:TetR family transcriptional regulator n=2 Tax=Rhodococcus hoagii TaxID=43767 RepID=A0A9Q2SAW1_RHOHA|nr:TetR/AcrR family transcriptional regulator [Prescottella equi]MBM4490776.1 TetR family transcriptional regulator [Prescottella equi]MBM4568588.1 TetR family transcriptional regulator [Prescottella equi]MBM4613753.1 TetR family transcriptional regulator [Prescottella equi]MBM4615728.1 TetR family transcriptional regulator [Prescottella equi]MBM4658974.1 TetR family transcriptional regulator [Prescottella equi]